MITELFQIGGGAVVGGVVSFFAAKKIYSANAEIYIEQSKAKAKVIEHEAVQVLHDAIRPRGRTSTW